MKKLTLGIDIGSTTVKLVALDQDEIVYKKYERHFSKVREKTCEMLRGAGEVLRDAELKVALTGSAGLGVAKAAGLEFVQEVFATRRAVGRIVPQADVVIELGGEDAKIIYLTGDLEERMNGTCAGGTGAFIDQMAILLNVDVSELDELCSKVERIYTIASRCGVFAKTDIQPLLNQGARKEDIAASIFQAVVNQTLAGLAQGREIKGDVLFLGGPLFFFHGLQRRFVETLKLDAQHAHFPEIAPYAVAAGAACYAEERPECYTFDQLLDMLEQTKDTGHLTAYLPVLFENQEEYDAFTAEHNRMNVEYQNITMYQGDAYLGIDCGSTTTKIALIGEDNQLLYQYYSSNQGNPLDLVHRQLMEIRQLCGDRIHIRSSAVTGYGEDLIRNAFLVDYGLVETMAHYRAARFFCPDVDFIIDIGGQDIKCFKIRNQCIDSIMLNEACSSGCGSFIETFARSMDYTIEQFCKIGLFSKHPIDLGSRCTVFMNSSVKQAQKDGASIEDISAGLSVSVVKNAIYKVIRATSPDELGQHIVVQGGTFLNDAILRSFEMEIGRKVTRPVIAGLMGAFGAALYAKERAKETSTLLDGEALTSFTHESRSVKCNLCTNHCNLTVNTFSQGTRFISGNRCDRPLGKGREKKIILDMYQYKLDLLKEWMKPSGQGEQIGVPMGLNLYELLPFWKTFFSSLGFQLITSDLSTRELYSMGQSSIPSDTACYPAKLIHGHIENLLEKGVKTIFYPCMTYNLDEERSDNCFNCPVVAYYPELLKANMKHLQQADFWMPYLELNHPKSFVKVMHRFFREQGRSFTLSQIKRATRSAFETHEAFRRQIAEKGKEMLEQAQQNDMPIAVIVGRPYHIDPEINHGIHQLITSYGMAVLSEDSVSDLAEMPKVHVLNQWTYHSRMYAAADFVCHVPQAQLIQLVSFGCGIDAITSDEIRAILESHDKIYTQLKIDEINNLGAAKIRIRSLLAAIEERKTNG